VISEKKPEQDVRVEEIFFALIPATTSVTSSLAFLRLGGCRNRIKF
jgi:hypothetical protein